MPLRRSSHPLLLGLALVALLAACGTTEEETATTTTAVEAAAGSGFCLTWGRYQESLGDWLLEPPESLDAAASAAATSLRAAEEARSEAPDDLEAPLDEVVAAVEAAGDAVASAEELPDALTAVSGLLQGTDVAAATTAATDWVAVSC